MKTQRISATFRRTLIALAAIANCLAAQAQSAQAATTFVAGVGASSGAAGERALSGAYSALREGRSAVGLFDIDYSLRKPETNTWVDLVATDLLGSTRELGLTWKHPGSWTFKASYGDLVHYDAYTVNTGLQNAGSTSPTVLALTGGAGSGADQDLSTQRRKLKLEFSGWLNPALQTQWSVTAENKDGSRLSGIGMSCLSSVAPGCLGGSATTNAWALLYLPEPISARHTQIEGRLAYAADRLRLNVGYYGSIFRNFNSTLTPTVPASLNDPLGQLLPLSAGLQGILSLPLALAPDNEAYQLDASGSYDISPTTRATFRLAYAKATQSDEFDAAGLGNAPAGSTSLGGRVTTSSVKLGLLSRPLPKLTLLADLRSEYKDDQTPIAIYNTEGAGATQLTYSNRALSGRKTHAKVQAAWQFPGNYKGTLGADYDAIDRGGFTATSAVSGISALRQRTEESTVYAQLHRRMSGNVSAAISLSSSRRDGSNWLRDNSARGLTEVTDPALGLAPTALYMPTLANRQRNKVKLSSDWQATERLGLQFSAESGYDRFDTPSLYGLRNSHMGELSVDWTFALSDSWSVNGYASRVSQGLQQARPAGYIMALDNTSLDASLGVSGKVSSTLRVGASLSYFDDRSSSAQQADTLASAESAALLAATGGLPDIRATQTALRLFGEYTLDKRSALRVNLVHQRSRINDWTWGYGTVPFVYSDGSTLTQSPNQSAGFVGINYIFQLN